MRSDRPNDQRGTAHRRVEDATVDTFIVRLPRWPVLLRLASRDPLVRTTDRIEALVLVLAIAVSLLAAPIAAAVGTAVYDSNRQLYTQQAQTRQPVAATVTDVPAAQHPLRTGTTTVSAQWTADGAQHSGTVTAPSTVKAGDTLEIWVDSNGEEVPAPPPAGRAAVEAAVGALLMWSSVAAVAAALFALTRKACDRIRFARWDDDLNNVAGKGDGRSPPPRFAR